MHSILLQSMTETIDPGGEIGVYLYGITLAWHPSLQQVSLIAGAFTL